MGPTIPSSRLYWIAGGEATDAIRFFSSNLELMGRILVASHEYGWALGARAIARCISAVIPSSLTELQDGVEIQVACSPIRSVTALFRFRVHTNSLSSLNNLQRSSTGVRPITYLVVRSVRARIFWRSILNPGLSQGTQ